MSREFSESAVARVALSEAVRLIRRRQWRTRLVQAGWAVATIAAAGIGAASLRALVDMITIY